MADDPATAAPPTPSPAQLVYLDVDDEITSAAARIRATDAERITLVLPYGSRLATSRINFRLLAREATDRGKRLDIVCADGAARALAAAAGLPVHASVAAFEASRGGSPAAPGSNGHEGSAGAGVSGAGTAAAVGAGVTGRQLALPELADEDDAPTRVIAVPRRSSPRVPLVGPARAPIPPRLAIAAGAGVVVGVLVLGLLALQLLPAATIVLHPRSQDVGPLSLTVLARADVLQPDETNLAIPAQRFTFPLSATDTFTATGTKPVDAKASGNVTFTNYDTSASNRIPAGAVVSTKSGIDFVTLDDVVVPASPIFPFPPSKASVGVQAVEAGPSGNVAAGTITVVPRTENKHLLDVTNEDPTGGGAHEDRTVVSASDISNALLALEGKLREQLDGQVAGAAGVPSGIRLFPETSAVGEATPTVDTATLLGTETAQFDLGVTAEGSLLGVDSSPIQGLAQARIGAKVEEGFSLASGSTSVQLGEPTVLGDTISFPVTVRASEVRNVDQAALAGQIRGLVLAQARSRLEPYGDVSISVWPDWVTTIPSNADRIDFSLGEPQPARTPGP
jgi:hypothetical protein